MKYGKKIFKIKSAVDASRFIRVCLNSVVLYSEGDYNSIIYFAKSYPFNTWKSGDYIEDWFRQGLLYEVWSTHWRY